MSDTSLTYRTREGDRWDLLAYQHYGDASLFEPIIRENLDQLPTPGVFIPAGLLLRIPILEVDPVRGPETLPWR